MGGGVNVWDLGRNGKDGIYIDRHGQLIAAAIIDIATDWSNFNAALLLARCALRVFAVVHHLQPHQPYTDCQKPECKKSGKDEKASVAALSGLGHYSLTN